MRDPPGEGQVGFIRVILAAMWTSDGRRERVVGSQGRPALLGQVGVVASTGDISRLCLWTGGEE